MEMKEKNGKKIGTKVSERKVRMLNDLVKLIKENSTIIISSLKGMPSAQFQKIRKKLKGRAAIKVIKKNVMTRAMEEASKARGEEHLKEIEKYLEEGSAIIFSQLDIFELAGNLADERASIKAKPGQAALQDIHIEAGATDMPAGPMISEFGSAGIRIAIEGGKIVVRESKVLVKQGEKISEAAASILGKLEILPFMVGLEPLAAFDAKTGKTYTGIKIDKHETLESFKKVYLDSRALAISVNYPAAEVIGMIIAKASMNARAIEGLIKIEQPLAEQAQQIEINKQVKAAQPEAVAGAQTAEVSQAVAVQETQTKT